jgi:hypothetical protein
MGPLIRVMRLGEYSLNGRLFTTGGFSKFTEVDIFWPALCAWAIFYKLIWSPCLTFGAIFLQTNLVTLPLIFNSLEAVDLQPR